MAADQTTRWRFSAREWVQVPGRGRIAIVDLGADDAPAPALSATVEVDGCLYRLRALERSRLLIAPPILSRWAGLLVEDARG